MTTKQFKIIAPITKTTDGEGDGAVYIEGIANTGQEDLAGDIITREALTQIVNQLPHRNLHLDHDKDFDGILGPIIESELRDEGAWFKARLVDERKDLIQSYLEQGVHFGTSISGDCTYEEGSMSNIVSWNLVELSLTDIPCDQGTMGTVSLAKSFDGILQSIKKQSIMEENNMAEENVKYLSEEEAVELINTAFNERKEEYLETIRDELKTEYEGIIGELTSRVEALENNDNSDEGDVPPVEEEKAETDEEEDEDVVEEEEKAESEEEEEEEAEEDEDKHIEELVNKRIEEILSGLNKNVDFKYSSEQSEKSQSDKTFSPHEIASL